MASTYQKIRKTSNNLVGGLITEAGDLTFPENASIDELNCVIYRKGTRSRRKGIEVETGGETNTTQIHDPNSTVESFLWDTVEDAPDVSFLVVQSKNLLHFYLVSTSVLSSTRKSFTVNLNLYRTSSNLLPGTLPCATSVVDGKLVVVHPYTEALVVEYVLSSDTIVVSEIAFKIRDFEKQDVTTEFDEQPTTLTSAYSYDLRNMGWDAGKVSTFYSSEGSYPPRNLFWWSGKDSSDNFSVSDYLSIYTGNSFAGNGHYILDLFNLDRSTASGVAGLTVEADSSRFSTCQAFAGRMFYAGCSSADKSNVVYFSKVVQRKEDLGLLYQIGDPTSEQTPDIIDDDGGYIVLSDCGKIISLVTFGNELLVLADNGVWFISGGDGTGFSATSYYVDYLSNTDCSSASSVVQVEGSPFWWSSTGAFTVERQESTGRPTLKNLTLNTIQSFYEQISNVAKTSCKGVYDKTKRVIYWMYPDNNKTPGSSQYSNVLLLDVTLSAFYPWKFSNSTTTDSSVVGGFFFNPIYTEEREEGIVDSELSAITNSALEIVTATTSVSLIEPDSKIKFLVVQDGGLTFGSVSQEGFLDWGESSFDSFFETAHEFSGDVYSTFGVQHVVCYFKRTETGFTDTDQGLSALNPSGCSLQVVWDQAESTNRFDRSRVYKAYRLDSKDRPTVSGPYSFRSKRVMTKTSVSGHGQQMFLRFSSEKGKDFDFEGYEIVFNRTSR